MSRPAPRSAPARISAPARSYSAPQRSYNPPARQNNSSTRSYSAPQRSSTTVSGYRPGAAPLTRQTVSAPTRSTNSGYRPNLPGRTNSVSVSGSSPRGGYPGRITNSAARAYTPNSGSAYTSTQVRGYSPTAGAGRYSNGNVRVAPTNPAYITSTQVSGVRPGGVRMPVNGGGVVVNQPIYNNYYVRNGNGYNRAPRYNSYNCAPRYNNCYDPYQYSNYNFRRSYRYYQPYAVPLLSLGFFVTRPYDYYDYSRIDYAQPFVYGEDQDYRSAPIANNEVASTQPVTPPSMEQELLTELSRYVESNSKDGRFHVVDPAFGNQTWNLDLTQAPAVYSIDTNHYSVVGGFEGTLGDNSIPSSVGVEFFVARDNGRWNIKDAWIVSANGIPRAKKFQSPAFPQVQTWQAGEACPFTGKPMVPISENAAQQG